MKSFHPKQKFKKSRSLIAIAVVVAVAIIFMALGITLALVEKEAPLPQVTGIEFLSEKLGATADFSKVYVKVIYSDKSTKEMLLSELLPTGLDNTREGLQNIVLSYGNKEYVVSVNVVLSNIKINYVTSGIGGEISGDLNQSIPAGESGSEVEAVPQEGYRFKEWSDGSANPRRREKNVSNDMTIRAIFEKNVFIVTFMAADGTSVEQKVAYGESAAPISNTDSRLKKYGYEFTGWDTDEWRNVTKSITVKPILVPIKAGYEISVSALSGEPMGTKNITDTNIETNPLYGKNESKGMENGYYVYKGYYQWKTDATREGAVPNPRSAISMIPAEGKLFDYWEVYGSVTENGAFGFIKINPGSDILLWLPGANTSIRFTAVNTPQNPNLEFSLAVGTSLLNVRAVYAKAKSTITFLSREVVLRTVELPFKDSLTDEDLSAPGEVAGNRFMGWYSTADNKKVETTHAAFYVDTVLVARFERIEITVTFQTESGDGIQSSTAKFGETVSGEKIPAAPSKEFYIFLGWKVVKCEGNTGLVGTSFTSGTVMSHDITVQPEYKIIIYDLNVSIVGQGSIKYSENSGEYLPLTSYLGAKAGTKYEFKFVPAAGHSFASYTVRYYSGSETGGQGNLTLNGITENLSLSAVFVAENRTVSVTNGVENSSGEVTILGTTHFDTSFAVDVLYGMPLQLTINAPQNKKIFSLSVNGVEKLPAGEFTNYTLNYEGTVTQDISIVITYADSTYSVESVVKQGGKAALYTYDAQTGEFTEVTDIPGTKFVYGTRLKMEIEANAGKFISNLSVFGKSVDLYQYYYESYSDSLYEEGTPYFFTDAVRKGFLPKDKRVTKITLYLPAPNKTTNISLSFEDIYYTVSATTVGFGDAKLDRTSVKEDGNVQLVLSTDASYAILGYNLTQHKSETPATKWVEIKDGGNSSVLQLEKIAADTEIEVQFGKRSYGVLFYNLSATGPSYQVTADGKTSTVDQNYNISYNLLHGGNKTFRLQAADGYLIKTIELFDGFGEAIPGGRITLPPNLSSYDLVFNNVTKAFGVKVTLEKRNYEVRLVTNVITKSIGEITFSPSSIDNGGSYPKDALSDVSGDATVFSYKYGEIVTVTIVLTEKYSIASLKIGGNEIEVPSGLAQFETEFAVTGNMSIELSVGTVSAGAGAPIIEGIHEDQGSVGYSLSSGTVIYTVAEKPGYVFKALYINETQIETSPSSARSVRAGLSAGSLNKVYTIVPSDLNEFKQYTMSYPDNTIHIVTAVFVRKEVRFQFSSTNGGITAEKEYVLYGEPATVYFAANTGYQLSTVKVNGVDLTAEAIAKIKQDPLGAYVIPGSQTTGVVAVGAKFTALPYQLTGTISALGTGSGQVSAEDSSHSEGSFTFETSYGSNHTFQFNAGSGSYISSIIIGGTAVEISSMFDVVIKASNGKYESGKYLLQITGDTTIEVRFDNDVFKVSVANTAGGDTSLNLSVRGDNEYNSDEKVTVGMNSNAGYHITSLYVNGILQELELFSTENLNLNTSLSFTIPAYLLVQNLVVRAEYTYNTYSVKVTVQNVSPNFKKTDSSSEKITDRIAMQYNGGEIFASTTDNDVANSTTYVTFRGIEHGGSPLFTIAPKINMGYEIKSALITYPKLFGGAPEQEDYTNFFVQGTNYTGSLPSLFWDISEFTVVLQRKVLSVRMPALVDVAAGKTAITVAPLFYTTQTNETIASEAKPQEGTTRFYEFGVRAALKIAVMPGFDVTKFLVNTKDETSVLNDSLLGGKATYSIVLNENVAITFAAEIMMLTLKLESSGRGSGTASFQGMGASSVIEVPYGTSISIVIIAQFAETGSYIHGFYIDDVEQPLDSNRHNMSRSFVAQRNSVYRVDYAIYEYTLRMGKNYPSPDEGVQGFSYNNAANNIFPWGTAGVLVLIELMPGYHLNGITVNDAPYTEFTMSADGNTITFIFASIKEDKKIVVNAEKKRFNAKSESTGRGITTMYLDGSDTPIENDGIGNIAYGDHLYIKLSPSVGYYAVSYTIKMKDLAGNTVDKEYPISYPNIKNKDIFRLDIESVTGEINVNVSYAEKEYDVVFDAQGFNSKMGTVTIGNPHIVAGDNLLVTIQTKNIMNESGGDVLTYNDIKTLTINGHNYFAQVVAGEGDWGSVAFTYDNVSKTYHYVYTFKVSDPLMNARNGVIGSGENRTLNLKIVMASNTYFAEEIIVKNLQDGGETPYKVDGGDVIHTQFMDVGMFPWIFDGNTTSVPLVMTKGYSPVSVSARVPAGDVLISTYEKNGGNINATITGRVGYANMTNPYKKTVLLLIIIDINKYDTEFAVLTNESGGGGNVPIGGDKHGVTITLNDSSASGSALNRVDHGGIVKITANKSDGYEFTGFEQFDSADNLWKAATNRKDETGKAIVNIDGNEILISVVQAFRFRAVYYKKVSVDVVIAPLHKYISGTNASGAGKEVIYSTYATLLATVGGAQKIPLPESTNEIYRYTFLYGDKVSLTAKDAIATPNGSKKATYYVQKGGREELLKTTASDNAFQAQFIATENYVYNESLSANTAIYVAFDNTIKLNSTTVTLGGKNSTDGGTVRYERKAAGASIYEALNFSDKTANVSMFDRIRVTIAVADGYRFESFSRFMTTRTGKDLVISDTLDVLGYYKAVDATTWELKNKEGLDDRFTRMEKTSEKQVILEFTVVNNSNYQIDFVKVYSISASVSAPRFVGDTGNSLAVEVFVADGNKSYFQNNAGKIDYGAKVKFSLPTDTGGLTDKTKWQFVSWYVNGIPSIGGTIRTFSAYTDYDAENGETVVFNDEYGFVSKEVDKREVIVYAEFLPIYHIATQEYLKDGGKNITFLPTSSFFMSGYYFPEAGSENRDVPVSKTPIYVGENDLSTSDPLKKYVKKSYLPYNVLKNSGLPAAQAGAVNTIDLNVVINNSYSILEWRIFYGGYNAENPDLTAGEHLAADQRSYQFKMTQEIYNKFVASGAGADGTITVVPIFKKQNAIQITKAVFYDKYGTASANGRGDNNPGIVIGGQIETISGLRMGDYGQEIILDANPNPAYRFIGWFDTRDGYESTLPISTNVRYPLLLDKTGNIYNSDAGDENGYVHYLDARYIRQITVNVSIMNTSGTHVLQASPNLLKATDMGASDHWIYGDNTVVGKGLSLFTLDADAGKSATVTKDVGSYLLFQLSTGNEGIFNSNYDKYSTVIAAGGGNVSTTHTQGANSTEHYFVTLMDQPRSIAVQYVTLGTFNFTGLLDRATVSLGAELSKTLQARYGDNINTCFVSGQYSNLEYKNNLLYVTLNPNNTSGGLSIYGVEKKDYREDILGFSLAGFSSIAHGALSQRFGVDFGGNANADKVITIPIQGMPFAGGGGSASSPYRISNEEQLKNINVMYEKNGNSVQDVHFIQTADILNMSANWVAMCKLGNGFNGTLNGGGKTLRVGGNLPGSNSMGLFAKTSVSSITNFKVVSSSDQAIFPTTAANAGVIAGEANGTTFSNLTFTGLNVSAATASFGLIAGVSNGGSVTNVVVTNFSLNYTGNNKGGLIGIATDTVLENLTLEKTDSSKTEGSGYTIGGFVGTLTGESAILRNSSIKGSLIFAGGGVGGAVGVVQGKAKVQNVTVQLSPRNIVTQIVSSNMLSSQEGTTMDGMLCSDVFNAKQYAAGGIVGINDGGTVTDCSIQSTADTLVNVIANAAGGAYTSKRRIAAVSVSGSVAGGIVGINAGASTVSECYVEKNAMVEILMTSRTGAKAGSDGVYGGIVGLNGGLIYHCGINGGLGGRTSFNIDQVGGGANANYDTDANLDANSAYNPFWTEGGNEKGMHYGSSVEFLYARYLGNDTSISSLDKKDGYLQGATFMQAHSGTYVGDNFAARGGSTTFMGGIAGRNNDRIINSYVEGKVVHFRRYRPVTGSRAFSVLGGVVGYNGALVYGSGILNSAVYNYVKPVTQAASGNDNMAVVAAGGVIGSFAGTDGLVQGLYSVNSAVRAVVDPYAEGGGNGVSGGSADSFKAFAAGIASAASNTGSGYFSFVYNMKLSGTQDCLGGYNTYKKLASSFGVIWTTMANGTWDNKGNANGEAISAMNSKSAKLGDGTTVYGRNLFVANGPAKLNSNGGLMGGLINFLGSKKGNTITL